MSDFVRPFNRDGRDFIWEAADLVCEAAARGDHAQLRHKEPRQEGGKQPPAMSVRLAVPPTIAHFVMNLPGSALTFVRHYKGVYAGREALFAPHTDVPLPLVHV